MKQFVITFCLFSLALTLPANGIRDDVEFTGDDTKTSYAFGMTVGDDLKQAGLEIDYPSFLEGLKAAMEGRPTIMDRDEALEVVQDAFESAMRKQYTELREKEAKFLEENAGRPNVQQTASGLQYVILEEGSGPKPEATDTVRVHYEGALTNGTIFDSSYQREEPEEIPLDMVIFGWAEGIMLMNVGGKHQVYIPSNLAYGERGAGGVIPPFSTLVFTIELLDIVTQAGEQEPAELTGNPETED
jgi:FKBP-type peptidyl-prolyl cis-trans isomerase